MKTLTMRELNRKTAGILDAVERGEAFELRRNNKVIGYLSQTLPSSQRKPDWDAHFEWLRAQKHRGGGFSQELDEDRKREWERDQALGKPS